jgi:hypothetical protein
MQPGDMPHQQLGGLNMSTDKPTNGERLRATAETIVGRIERDPAFAQQIRDDPRAALLAAGVPEAQINDELFLAIEATNDVSGYSKCTDSCGLMTCGPRTCGGTCYRGGTCGATRACTNTTT